MFAKTIMAGLLGTTLLAGAALAQSPTTSSTTDSATTTTTTSSTSHKGEWRGSKLIGVNVYNTNNESLGEINELLISQSGKVEAVVIGVGGFLGIGERNVAVPLEKIKWVNEPVPSSAGTSAATRPAGAPTGSTTGAATTTTTTTTTKSNEWYPDHAVYNATKDELKALPEFKYSS
jgi:sporulation protein YlmC with PRC-barrel domain